MIGKENDVCIKLVEYSKNGRVFRKWSYERLGERVKGTKWQDPSCPCDKADRITEENELKGQDHLHERSSGSPLARTLKQQRVVRQERDMEKEEEAITKILKMQAEMERKREVNIKRDKQKFEQRFDQFDKRNKGDSYNEITYQPTRKDIKHLVIHRRHRKTHSKPHHVYDKDPNRRSLPK
nr:unnamed protein product [Haemonchus contortus]